MRVWIPKVTLVAPVSPLPLIVTVVPPAVGPKAGGDARDGRRHRWVID